MNSLQKVRSINTVDVKDKAFKENGWGQRHAQAWVAPGGPERPIRNLLVGWADYADEHLQRYQSKIGDDGVLGPAWTKIGGALLVLLNGELGRFDGGTLDKTIREVAEMNGVKSEEL